MKRKLTYYFHQSTLGPFLCSFCYTGTCYVEQSSEMTENIHYDYTTYVQSGQGRAKIKAERIRHLLIIHSSSLISIPSKQQGPIYASVINHQRGLITSNAC